MGAGLKRGLLILGFGLIAGGILGSYATIRYLGPDPAVAPLPEAPKCPPCPACAKCEPVADIEPPEVPDPTVGLGIARTSTPAVPREEIPYVPGKPGLPASAIKLASEALKRELAPCIDTARAAGDSSGSLVLDLTITATGGIGHVRSAEIARAEGNLAGLDTCAVEAARRVQFEWRDDDGESKLRYPVQVGASP